MSGTATAKTDHVTTPCRTCDAPVVILAVLQPDGSHRTTALDPTLPVYHRIIDVDSVDRRAFWIEDKAPPCERRQALAKHRCAGRAS